MRDRHKVPGETLIQIALPEDLHHVVKVKATEQRTTLKAYIIEALRKSVVEKTAKK